MRTRRTRTRVTIPVLGAIVLIAAYGVALAEESAVETRPSETMTVDEVVHRTNYTAYYQGKDGRANVKMTIRNLGSDGKPDNSTKRVKELIILRMDADDLKAEDAKTEAFKEADAAFTGEQKFYVYFESPPDDKGTTFMVWKHLDRDDDRWLFLPNLNLVKRIAATDKRTSFVGSTFFYEDISGRNIDADKHELTQTEGAYYVLRNTPNDPGAVEFAYYDMYVDKRTFLPAYTWYYDEAGRKYRRYAVTKWKYDDEYGYPIVETAEMTDDRLGTTTTLEYSDVRFNIALPENLFTERFLKRTPYKYLK